MLQGCLTVIGGGVVLLVIIAILVSGGDGDEQAAGPTAIPSRAPAALTPQAERADVQVESPEANADPQPQPAATASSTPRKEANGPEAETEPFVPIQTGEGRTFQGVAYSVVQDPIDDALATFVGVIDSEADEFAFEPATLVVGCFEGRFAVLVSGMPFTLLENELDVEYRFDDETAFADKWLIVDDGGFDTAVAVPKPREFAARLRAADTLVVRGTSNTNDTATAQFKLAGLFETPVQPNLDHCGEY